MKAAADSEDDEEASSDEDSEAVLIKSSSFISTKRTPTPYLGASFVSCFSITLAIPHTRFTGLCVGVLKNLHLFFNCAIRCRFAFDPRFTV